jgi:hypothetical protein
MNSLIYKIVSKDMLCPFTYIGSTTNFYNRKALHKSDYHNIKSPRHKLLIYEFIRNNGDWTNFVFIIIETYNCINKRQLEMREQYWKDIYCDTIGFKRAYITKEQMSENSLKIYYDNRAQILEKKRQQYANDKSKKQQYYRDNKMRILKKLNENYHIKKSLEES